MINIVKSKSKLRVFIFFSLKNFGVTKRSDIRFLFVEILSDMGHHLLTIEILTF
jgi:hypothetical protein